MFLILIVSIPILLNRVIQIEEVFGSWVGIYFDFLLALLTLAHVLVLSVLVVNEAYCIRRIIIFLLFASLTNLAKIH